MPPLSQKTSDTFDQITQTLHAQMARATEVEAVLTDWLTDQMDTGDIVAYTLAWSGNIVIVNIKASDSQCTKMLISWFDYIPTNHASSLTTNHASSLTTNITEKTHSLDSPTDTFDRAMRGI